MPEVPESQEVLEEHRRRTFGVTLPDLDELRYRASTWLDSPDNMQKALLAGTLAVMLCAVGSYLFSGAKAVAGWFNKEAARA